MINFKDRANAAELDKFKDAQLKKLDSLISIGMSGSDDEYKRAALISYWLQDFNRYLVWEKSFDPTKLKRYERGDIIKVNLGFNVGSEEGGMHYAVVVDNKNKLNSSTITIIPLSSKKTGVDIYPDDVDLGNEIYTKLKLKSDEKSNSLIERIKSIEELIDVLYKLDPKAPETSKTLEIQLKKLQSDLDIAKKERDILKKVDNEIRQMKVGSIGLVSQISTVSKLRIYDPRNNSGVLSGIKLSPEKLDLLNNKMKELFVR